MSIKVPAMCEIQGVHVCMCMDVTSCRQHVCSDDMHCWFNVIYLMLSTLWLT